MLAKKHPQNKQRLEVLRDFDVLDSGKEKIYDDITQLTAEICETPLCFISLVSENRLWFKSEVGFGLSETTIDESICSHAILQDDFIEITDTRLDERSINHPLGKGDKPALFYAGAVLRSFDNWPIGMFVVMDYKPRVLTPLQRRVLKVHANNIMQQLELSRARAKSANDKSSKPNDDQGKNAFYNDVRARFETLTPREKEVVGLMAHHSGSLSSKELARELGISPRTVDHHRASIMLKMNVDSIAELIIVGLKAGVLT